jgi:hypothetical protein
MSKEKDIMEADEKLVEPSVTKNTQKNEDDCLEPEWGMTQAEWGVSYEKFVSEKETPGTPSCLAHQLMEGLAGEELAAAKGLIEKTLQSADLLSYILKEAETNPGAADAIRKEIIKMLRKQGIEE